MMNRLGLLGVVVAALFAFTGVAKAQEKLEVGNTAPGLDIKKWLNGDAVTIEKGSTYVVEFWATWCGPCKKSIPHLNDLHNRFAEKGLVIIGVSDEAPDVVESFVEAQGSRMSYHVAVDRQKATSRAWMQAAGQKGIPCAFIVDKNSKVVFIGHPLDPEFERAVKLTLKGRFDPKKEKTVRPALEAADKAARLKNWRQAYKHFDDVIAIDRSVFSNIALRKFEMMLADEKNKDAAYAYAKAQIKEYEADSEALAMFAKDIASNPRYSAEERDLDVALAAANAMVATAGDKSPEALATLALVLSARGEHEQAVERQMEAWMIAPAAEKAEYRRLLDKYRSTTEKAKASIK